MQFSQSADSSPSVMRGDLTESLHDMVLMYLGKLIFYPDESETHYSVT
jgi:hypothetical protein